MLGHDQGLDNITYFKPKNSLFQMKRIFLFKLSNSKQNIIFNILSMWNILLYLYYKKIQKYYSLFEALFVFVLKYFFLKSIRKAGLQNILL